MRRLLLLVAVLVFVDTMLYAALTPLLPHFADEFGLSKSRAGALVAAYAAGALVGGLPGGFAAARLGARRAVIVGLTAMGLASVGFALAGGFWALFAARLLQGGGSAFTWAGAFAWLLAAAPRERRGALIGSAMGAAVFGALFGPVVGAAAALAGRGVVFCALAGLAVVLIVWTLRLESPPPGEQPSACGACTRASQPAVRGRPRADGARVAALRHPLRPRAAAPLARRLGRGGDRRRVARRRGAREPYRRRSSGRLMDERGRLLPVRVALTVGAVLSLGLAAEPGRSLYVPLIVVAAMSYGVLFTPAFALIADGAEHVGLAQGMAFGLMNAAWAIGAMVGPAAGGAIAGATGDWIPFVLASLLCASALAALRSGHERPAVLVDRLPGDAARVGRE